MKASEERQAVHQTTSGSVVGGNSSRAQSNTKYQIPDPIHAQLDVAARLSVQATIGVVVHGLPSETKPAGLCFF